MSLRLPNKLDLMLIKALAWPRFCSSNWRNPRYNLFATKSDSEVLEIHFALKNNMAERRKIVIETGAEPSEPLPTPHFDAEATMTARPVVPLNDQETQRPSYGDYRARSAKPFWKRPALLVPIILAAVGIGIAAGFAIGLYRNRSAAQPPVVTAPTPSTENTDLSQKVEPPPVQESAEPQARTPVPEETEETKEPEEPTAAPKDEERERSARNERRDDDDDNNARQPAIVKPPSPAREKKPIKVDEYEIEDVRAERQAERERRREERRGRRRRQREDEIGVPRGIERGVREADRIREIFEGRQP
jgi:hypothetical protein